MTKNENKKRGFQMPHVFIILLLIMVLVTLLSYLIPSGPFERTVDEATGIQVVVPDTFRYVENETPITFMNFFEAVYNGFVNGAIKPVSEASGYSRASWNGPFDAAPKAAWASVGAVSRRFLELTQHSDAVWALFNNEMAAGKAGRLLFSASASGTLLCSDLERGRRREEG